MKGMSAPARRSTSQEVRGDASEGRALLRRSAGETALLTCDDLAGPDVMVLDLSVGSTDPAVEATSADAAGRPYTAQDAPAWTEAIYRLGYALVLPMP